MNKYNSIPNRRKLSNNITRNFFQDIHLSKNDFIYPFFVSSEEDNRKTNISTIEIFSKNKIMKHIEKMLNIGVQYFMPFPVIPKHFKTENAEYCFNENNFLLKLIKEIKTYFSNDIFLITDVALDPYTSHGHDGIIKNNIVDNFLSIEMLKKQSILLAESGADAVSPSDMMDFRIKEIRDELDKNKFYNTKIVSYSIKYASNLYFPFRDILGSNLSIISDKKTYQMNYKNSDYTKYIDHDIKSGADSFIIKPSYADIIKDISIKFPDINLIAYHVTGQLFMIDQLKNINHELYQNVLEETIFGLKRSGAKKIITYAIEDVYKFI